jgi:hypothetical protein
MIDLEQLQVLEELLDNMQIIAQGLEKTYDQKNIEGFVKHKKEILDIQRKISTIIR